jgi:hypothetical protein
MNIMLALSIEDDVEFLNSGDDKSEFKGEVAVARFLDSEDESELTDDVEADRSCLDRFASLLTGVTGAGKLDAHAVEYNGRVEVLSVELLPNWGWAGMSAITFTCLLGYSLFGVSSGFLLAAADP